MLSRVLQGLQGCRGAILTQFRRNLGVTAVLSQKAAAADLDPIQQLFLDKVREYAKKAKPGELLDATPEVTKGMKDELEKLTRAYGAEGQDFTKFPTFSFTDPRLEPVGVNVDIRDEIDESETAETESFDDKADWET